MSDITPLLPWVNEPYRKNAVLEAARKLPQPFILREIVSASGLPTQIVHSVLGRLVKQGVLTRSKLKATHHHNVGGRWGKPVFRPHGSQRLVWAYRFAEGE